MIRYVPAAELRGKFNPELPYVAHLDCNGLTPVENSYTLEGTEAIAADCERCLREDYNLQEFHRISVVSVGDKLLTNSSPRLTKKFSKNL